IRLNGGSRGSESPRSNAALAPLKSTTMQKTSIVFAPEEPPSQCPSPSQPRYPSRNLQLRDGMRGQPCRQSHRLDIQRQAFDGAMVELGDSLPPAPRSANF